MSRKRYYVQRPDGSSFVVGQLDEGVLIQRGDHVRFSETRSAFVVPMQVREDEDVTALEVHDRHGFVYNISKAEMARYGVQGTLSGMNMLFLPVGKFEAKRDANGN